MSPYSKVEIGGISCIWWTLDKLVVGEKSNGDGDETICVGHNNDDNCCYIHLQSSFNPCLYKSDILLIVMNGFPDTLKAICKIFSAFGG